MGLVEILIIISVSVLFIYAVYKIYKNTKASKAGLGCAGCRVADTCQKPENTNFKKINNT